MKNNCVHIRVWGDWACFTRPEMKVERVSYPVMTPSAARGILEAVFWEPQVYYLVAAIRVVQRGRWASIRRNEVQSVISLRNVGQWMANPKKFSHHQGAGGGAPDGTQRNMLALQEVEYIVSAEMRPTRLADRKTDTPMKYLAEFKRRAQQGKCFHRPALGMREFAADFDWVDDPQATLEQRAAEPRRQLAADRRGLGFDALRCFPAKGARYRLPLERPRMNWGPSPRRAPRVSSASRRNPKHVSFAPRSRIPFWVCHPDAIEILEP